MPLYTYSCPNCGKLVERFRKVEQRDNYRSICSEIDELMDMQRVLTPPHLHGSPNMPND